MNKYFLKIMSNIKSGIDLTCPNCKQEDVEIDNFEYTCMSCGFVLTNYGTVYTTDYQMDLERANNRKLSYSRYRYFLRKINCLQAKQIIRSKKKGEYGILYKKALTELQNKKIKEIEDIHTFLKEKAYYNLYIDVHRLYLDLNRLEQKSDKDNFFRFQDCFKTDLCFLYRTFLNHACNIKANICKVCRMLLLKMKELTAKENIDLPYDIEEYLEYFKDLKSIRRVINEEKIEKIIKEMNYEDIIYKYRNTQYQL